MGKSQTTKIRPSYNPRARRVFYITVGILLWAQIIAVAAIIEQIITEGFSGVSLPAVTLELLIFISFAGGTYAIWSVQPPFHYLLYLGAILNIIFSVILIYSGQANIAFLQLLLSLLVIYLGIRYPIEFTLDEATFRYR